MALGVSTNDFIPIPLDTINCNACEGTIYFDNQNPNISPLFTTQYLLTDTNNVITQVSHLPFFDNVLPGKYFLYSINYKLAENISGNTPGNSIANILSNCLDVSIRTPITICPLASGIKVVSGKVFMDDNEDGLDNDSGINANNVTVFIYEDSNQDGMIDGGDRLLGSDTTDIFGQYSHTIKEMDFGRNITHLVITIDTTTIDSINYLTTDNIETSILLGSSGLDGNNDFGISQQIDLQNDVWLDLNANSLQDPLEIGIPNMSICISNVTPLLLNGILIPPFGYQDTIITDNLGVFTFKDLPDCEWQIVTHFDPVIYTPTFDADAGTLGTTNFILNDGKVSPSDNPWCTKEECLDDLDFGFRLSGEYSLSGNVCIDDGTKDGRCNTGGEELLTALPITLFYESGNKLGSITTDENGAYLFPFLPENTYVVNLGTTQSSLDTLYFTTKLEHTPAYDILITTHSIFQKVFVEEDIIGVDFAFIPHLFVQSIEAIADNYIICPGQNFGGRLATNDIIETDNFNFSLVEMSILGTVQIASNGIFTYFPDEFHCTQDQFTYQLCDVTLNVCDTATVTLFFNDDQAPTLTNVPEGITINCNEYIPDPVSVSAFDNCPKISINLNELSTRGEDGCSQYDYTLTRTWVATDFCGNSKSSQQTIAVQDTEAPDIFRIYTLPNGKKIIGGIANFTGERWKTVNFPIDFETSPLVFSQIITNNEASPAIVQTRNVSSSQFEIHLQEEEANDGIHNRESVAWIAIEKGNQIDDYNLIADFEEIDHTIKSLNFYENMGTLPAFFTSLQTTNEQNPAIVRYENLHSLGVAMQLVEEASKDIELNHQPEKVAYLAIENIGNLTNKKGDIIGEVGTTTTNSEWKKITLKHTYHNPIILVNTANTIEHFPVTLRVNNILANSFDVQIQEWDYLSFTPSSTPISYLVIEGSIPLYSTEFCNFDTDSLTIGTDIKAIDNCDNSVNLLYSESSQFIGAQLIINRTWQSSDECKNKVSYTQKIACEGIAVKIQTFLQGALIGSLEEGLMRDDLRKKGFIPFQEPYTKLSNFEHFGLGGGEVMDTNLLAVTGPTAIVDWIFLELRNAENSKEVIATSSGLLQRNGTIISPTGDSLVVFQNVPFGDYFISVRHRNHIGIASKTPYSFSLNTIPELDFRNTFTPVNGNYPNIQIGNRNAQWSGDINGDGKTIYQGPNNDPFEIFLHVILDDDNTHYLTNYITKGYTQRDFNLDGQIIFQGPNNDKANLLFNTILVHPNNINHNANYIISVLGN